MSRRDAAPHCPDCPGAPAAVPLVFGLPSVEVLAEGQRGEVVLGGCELPESGEAEWACPRCRHPLGTPARERSAPGTGGEMGEPGLGDTELFPTETTAPLGAAEADEALWMLVDRVVLTAAVCHELQRSNGDFAGRRPRAALNLLLRWIETHFPTGRSGSAGDGLQDMLVPDGAEPLMAEVRAGVPVCDALDLLWTADSLSEYEGDMAHIRRLLERYPY